MDRPKQPKQEFKRNERDFKSLLNGMANTITNILDYLEKDKRATDRLLKNKKRSELTVAEVRQQRLEQEQNLEDIQKELSDLKQKVQDHIINNEQN